MKSNINIILFDNLAILNNIQINYIFEADET